MLEGIMLEGIMLKGIYVLYYASCYSSAIRLLRQSFVTSGSVVYFTLWKLHLTRSACPLREVVMWCDVL